MERNSLLLQVECTYYFEENPYALETADSLAVRLGRSAQDLEPVLSNLATLSVLSRIGEGADAVYRYIRPTIITEKLEAR